MLQDHKGDFRKLCIKRLKFVSQFSTLKNDKKIVNSLYQLIDDLQVKKVLLYLPLDMEVDLKPLIRKLRREKRVEVYVPYMLGDSFKVVKYRLPLHKKRFGIKEPSNSFRRVKVDLVVVPTVGVDGAFKRVGFGAGMYDRFYDRIAYRPITIFTQRKLCYTDKILSNHYDIQADYIITK